MNEPQTELEKAQQLKRAVTSYRYWKIGLGIVAIGLGILAYGKDWFRDERGYINYDLMMLIVMPLVAIPIFFVIWKIIKS